MIESISRCMVLITCVVIWHYHHKIYLQLLNIRHSIIFCLQKPSYPWLQILEALSVNLLPALNEGDDDEWCTVMLCTRECFFYLAFLEVQHQCELAVSFRETTSFGWCHVFIWELTSHTSMRIHVHFYLKHDPFPSLSPFDFLHPFPPCTCQHTLDIRAM